VQVLKALAFHVQRTLGHAAVQHKPGYIGEGYKDRQRAQADTARILRVNAYHMDGYDLRRRDTETTHIDSRTDKHNIQTAQNTDTVDTDNSVTNSITPHAYKHQIHHLVIDADGLLNQRDDGDEKALKLFAVRERDRRSTHVSDHNGGDFVAKHKALHDEDGLQHLHELAHQRQSVRGDG
jgi:hypothetical protein